MREVSKRVNTHEEERLAELIRGSYSDFVRLERRNLLLSSWATIIGSIIKINPSTAGVMGFTFENLTASSFYIILDMLTAYFLFAFLIYSIPNYRDAKLARKSMLSSSTLEYSVPWYSMVPPNLRSDIKYKSWMFIHFIFPVISAALAIGIATCKII
jgi:hypothetical protein